MKIKKKNSSLAETIQYARQHFNYCAAGHRHSLDGTLVITFLRYNEARL
jgi:hypothetical protein